MLQYAHCHPIRRIPSHIPDDSLTVDHVLYRPEVDDLNPLVYVYVIVAQTYHKNGRKEVPIHKPVHHCTRSVTSFPSGNMLP